jgi:hypothetical protein
MTRISVLIPDAEAENSKRVALCLKTSGRVILHGLSRRSSMPLRTSSLFATFDCSMEKIELGLWLKRVDEIVARQQIDVVLPTSDFSIRALSEHGPSLACADRLAQLPNQHTFDMATNKASLAKFLTVHGIPQPPTVLVTVGAQMPDGLSALNFPVLAKPPLLAGGRGIQRCKDPAELDDFLADKPTGEIWVVQELVKGHDVCVNALCQKGKVIASTAQHAIDQSPYSFGPPTDFEFKSDLLATGIAGRLIEKLSWSGIANIDMRFDTKRNAPVVLEVNGRYWASLLGSMNAGVNFPLLACEAISGSTVSNRHPRDTRYFRGKSNMLQSLTGGGKHRVKPSETDLRYFVQDPVRLAWYLTSKAAESIRDKLFGEYAPAGGGR